MHLNDLPVTDYETDFALWLERQLAALQVNRLDQLDVEHVLEELGGILRHQHRETKHRLRVILAHLLKCQFQSEKKGRSWAVTLFNQRQALADLFEQSPSLRRRVGEYAADTYPSALRLAAVETGLPISSFPASSPFSEEQLLDQDFLS